MKQYLTKTAWLILLLVATALLFAFSVAYGFYISAVVIAAAIAGEAWIIFRHMENSSRVLKQFIWSIRYSDFLTSYAQNDKNNNRIAPELAEAMEEAIVRHKQQLQEKESQLQYFQALANHIDLSILVFSADGKIEWLNYAAQLLTGLKKPEQLDDLSSFQAELPSRLRALRPGELSILQVTKRQDTIQLVLSSMVFVVLGRQLTVVSMKNIRSVLEDKEIEAWQKLIRVLTHEIMNSMTPIVSLSELLQGKLQTDIPLSAEEQQEVNQAITTIHKRSNGLLHFVDNYRKVTGIPAPNMQVVQVKELLEEFARLYGKHNPPLRVIYPPVHLQIIADKGQIEQVLINLIKNAFEATAGREDAEVCLSAGINTDGQTYMEVRDNGAGISPSVLERIFIPFFTTKPAGSGIGLSISRQIMHAHRGTLTATSTEEKGSRFVLSFPGRLN
ncbi:ATP-binding protein [Parabacteroides sp. OttesenSCG-928-K15]|nr:ATP-binding protein [Parabacteroides sp. OttesenSCG-928-K15]